VLVLEKGSDVGGVWSTEGNEWSRVNHSEPAYRMLEKDGPRNFFHPPKSQLLWDCTRIASSELAHRIRLRSSVISVSSVEQTGAAGVEIEGNYIIEYDDLRNGDAPLRQRIRANQVVLCVNRRLGKLRQVSWKNEHLFKGEVRYGVGNQIQDVNFVGKRVLIVGGGAFATENARTVIEKGASSVLVLSRRRGSSMPQIIDYLGFVRPRKETFENDATGSARSFSAWQQAYEACGVSPPECWKEGRIAPVGHTITVSDIWLVAHYYGLLSTR